MKATTPAPRASHVNTGTSVPHDELPWPETSGRVFRLPKTDIEIDQRSEVTPYGGLSLFGAFVRRSQIAERLDDAVQLFKVHLPYHESDHILAIAANLFVGGTCLEDQTNLQRSEAVPHARCGSDPDPTTAGDFLRRFEGSDLASLRRAHDALGARVGRAVQRRRGKLPLVTVDLDGHYKLLYGVQKEGADFNYKSQWSYHPLVASLAETGEYLAIRNRPGNVRSSEDAAQVMDAVLPQLKERGARLLVRGDSDFDRQDLRDMCKKHGAYIAIVGRAHTGRPEIAKAIPEQAYRPFRPRAWRAVEERVRKQGFRARARKPNRRRNRARERNYIHVMLTSAASRSRARRTCGCHRIAATGPRRLAGSSARGTLFSASETMPPRSAMVQSRDR